MPTTYHPTVTKTPLSYLRDELNGKGDFIKEYKVLDPKDKDDLKRYAAEDMAL